MLCYAMLCYAMLCYAMLRYAARFSVNAQFVDNLACLTTLQICGIADSGLNDLSCFFYDGPSSSPASSPATTSSSHVTGSSISLDQFSSSANRGVLTNRSGVIEPFRRKVIQYVPYADMFDELGADTLPVYN